MKSKWLLMTCSLVLIGWTGSYNNSQAGNPQASKKNTVATNAVNNAPAMNGWSTFLIKGNVEKVIYDDGRYIYFNKDGNVLKHNVRERVGQETTKFEYTYTNPTHFVMKGDKPIRYKIVFVGHTRKEVGDNSKALGLTFTYDAKSRLISVHEEQVIDYSGEYHDETYTYEGINTYPSKEEKKIQFEDATGTTENFIFSNYIFDNQGNWTSRAVKYKKTNDDGNGSPKITTKNYVEKRTITYF
jgi:hypothetical protein